jgi:hypothetical protein
MKKYIVVLLTSVLFGIFVYNAYSKMFLQIPTKGFAASARDTTAAFELYDLQQAYLISKVKVSTSTTYTIDINILTDNSGTWTIDPDLTAAFTAQTANGQAQQVLRNVDTNRILGETFKLDRNVTITGDSITLYQYINAWGK